MTAWILALLLNTAAPGDAAGRDDECAVTIAALKTYFNLVHGGTAIAFPEHRRPVLLHRTTISPSREQLRRRVSSPANRAAAMLYSEPAVQELVARLLSRNVRMRSLDVAPAGFALGHADRGACGPEHDLNRFADAVAVSRPAFGRNGTALIYLEQAGGACAYHLTRRDGAWSVDWSVELWACG